MGIEMTVEEKSKLKSDELINSPIEILGRKYFLKEQKAEGKKSVVWVGIDDFSNTKVAIKFATRRDYEDTVYLAEVRKSSPLYSYSQFPKYLGAEEKTVNSVDCVVF